MNKKSFPSGHNPYPLEHLEKNRFQCLRISLRVFKKKKSDIFNDTILPLLQVLKMTKEVEGTNKS